MQVLDLREASEAQDDHGWQGGELLLLPHFVEAKSNRDLTQVPIPKASVALPRRPQSVEPAMMTSGGKPGGDAVGTMVAFATSDRRPFNTATAADPLSRWPQWPS